MAQKIIYTTPEGTLAVVHPTGEVAIEQLVSMVVPDGLEYDIVDEEVIPTDRTFRGAWTAAGIGSTDPTTVEEDLVKSAVIAHDIRRVAREIEFAPHDERFAKQIPGTI